MPEPLVSREEASREATARAVRLVEVLAPLWQAARRWTGAIVIFLFPVLFILDESVDLPLSPVIPGLALLFLLILGLPFLIMEVWARRYRRKETDWQVEHAERLKRNGRTALVVSLVVLGLWFAVGT